jgi:hypothetical protein
MPATLAGSHFVELNGTGLEEDVLQEVANSANEYVVRLAFTRTRVIHLVVGGADSRGTHPLKS